MVVARAAGSRRGREEPTRTRTQTRGGKDKKKKFNNKSEDSGVAYTRRSQVWLEVMWLAGVRGELGGERRWLCGSQPKACSLLVVSGLRPPSPHLHNTTRTATTLPLTVVSSPPPLLAAVSVFRPSKLHVKLPLAQDVTLSCFRPVSKQPPRPVVGARLLAVLLSSHQGST
ncbi:hypothetical protein Droror1_Dr00012237 [Drosera rotundifolia]